MYLWVYVNNIIIIGTTNFILKSFPQKFSIKDLGALHFFLNVKVISTPIVMSLFQHTYILDLLKRTNMSEAKDVTTSISFTTSLSLHDSSALIDSKLYQSIVGAL